MIFQITVIKIRKGAITLVHSKSRKVINYEQLNANKFEWNGYISQRDAKLPKEEKVNE